MELSEYVGHKIKVRRVEQRMSQTDLANRLDITQSYVSSIEKGQKNVSINMLGKIAEALDCYARDFFDETRRAA